MSTPRDFNYPLPTGRIVNADGTPTLQEQAFRRRLWERTGSAPGTDVAYIAQQCDLASMTAERAAATALAALKQAAEVLDMAQLALARASAVEAATRKCLERCEEIAILSATTGAQPRAGNSEGLMIQAIMTRPR